MEKNRPQNVTTAIVVALATVTYFSLTSILLTATVQASNLSCDIPCSTPFDCRPYDMDCDNGCCVAATPKKIEHYDPTEL